MQLPPSRPPARTVRLAQRALSRVGPFTLFAVACVAAGNGGVSHAAADRARFGAAWARVDCTTFDVPPAIASQSDCGYVTVPELHAQPHGRTIQLGVVRTRSSGRAPAADPLVVEQGGPGDSTIGDIVNGGLPKFPELPALLKGRDLIFVEERGTRFAKPFLFCPEHHAHNIAVAKGQIPYTDASWIQACNQRLKAQGINPSAFNTRENAADIYTVVETLRYPQFNYYGVSYGTLLGQYVIAQADQHKAKLRSVILDGVVRPDVDFNLASSHTFSYALRNVFQACAQNPACNAAYPRLEQTFLAIVDELNRKPLPLTLTIPSSKQPFVTKLDGNAFVTAMVPYLARPYSGESTRGSSLPRFIKAASQGNFAWVAEALSDLEPPGAKEMYHTVLCARARSIRVDPAQVLPPAYPQLVPLGLREAETVNRACEVLQVEQKPPFVYRNRQIPTLVLNGSYDPVTPAPYGEAVAKNLTTATVVTFPGVGHGALFAPGGTPAAACVTQIAADFLARPTTTPDSRCVDQVKPAFVVE
ncbi:alpha/beta fold hydrolase [Synechococcus sp. MW101C3]|uniref:alpha/beta fold hydrolase n=1 Tax=Synechococcus sp. MW101C3 TaxID=210768 RepID=UPI000B992A7D|nr:alpha/beta hydrolase [Synechococcus sp. MW101C3]